jgi:hypothetical protein
LKPGATVYWFVEIRSSNGKFESRLIDVTDPKKPVDVGATPGKKRSYRFEECGVYDNGHGNVAEFRYHESGCHARRRDKAPLVVDPPVILPTTQDRATPSGGKAGMMSENDGLLTLWFSCDRTCCFADEDK